VRVGALAQKEEKGSSVSNEIQSAIELQGYYIRKVGGGPKKN